MNIKEERKYYVSMVRKFREEYNSKCLWQLCKDQKVSYNKMLHCLKSDSHRKPQPCPRQASHSKDPQLLSLVIETPLESQSVHTVDMAAEQKVGQPVDLKQETSVDKKLEMASEKKQEKGAAGISVLENVELNVSSRLSLRIGSCNSKELVSLINELESGLC